MHIHDRSARGGPVGRVDTAAHVFRAVPSRSEAPRLATGLRDGDEDHHS